MNAFTTAADKFLVFAKFMIAAFLVRRVYVLLHDLILRPRIYIIQMICVVASHDHENYYGIARCRSYRPSTEIDTRSTVNLEDQDAFHLSIEECSFLHALISLMEELLHAARSNQRY